MGVRWEIVSVERESECGRESVGERECECGRESVGESVRE